MEFTEDVYKERKYFSITRKYTLALLNAFNGVNFWVEGDNTEQKQFTIPISFGNYEKALVLNDIPTSTIKKGNFDFLPRLVLSYEGLEKAPQRQTNKFQKLSKKMYDSNSSEVQIDASYNSISYDYRFKLLLQARGLTISSQVTEEILSMFNPSLNLEIRECPLFDEPTETQILISDPDFSIIDEFENEQTNIIQVSFDITVRGNIYSPIELSGLIQTVKMFTYIWDDYDYQDAKLASYYRFDVADTGKVYKQTQRVFNGTIEGKEHADFLEAQVIQWREDYVKYQIQTIFDDNEYFFEDENGPIDDNL